MPAPPCSGMPHPQAGFTTGVPWIKVNPNYPQINAAQALADPDSIFYYYQKLIQLRKTIPAVVYGSYELILPEHAQIYAFTRTLADDRLLVVLNFSTQPRILSCPVKSQPEKPPADRQLHRHSRRQWTPLHTAPL